MQFTDQLNNTIELGTFPPRKIVSLVPSQTELLYDLGLGSSVAAQTFFCIHPREHFESSAKIGGTKTLDIEKIRTINPDLIIGNKEENVLEQIQVLQQDFPVWMSDIYTLDDSLSMISSVGDITGTAFIANTLCNNIRESFSKPLPHAGKALYLIWNDPVMAAGKNTFISEMMYWAGFDNALEDTTLRYPQLSNEDIHRLNPDYILLSTEPYPFSEKHLKRYSEKYPLAKVILVDGEMFSWYGSRLAKTMKYFKELQTANLK